MIRKIAVAFFVALLFFSATANAGPFKDRLMARLGKVPETMTVTRDVHYGSNRAQTMDVYAPRDAENAPTIIMAHGGGWKRGDKSARGVVQNKIDHWIPRGFVVISVNYRMMPEAGPLEQAKDIAKALAYIQRNGSDWGVNPEKIVLMGHSAGAHLVSLLGAAPALAYTNGASKWLGTVALDSAAMNVVSIMNAPKHYKLYDDAFGTDQGYWQMASPYHQLNKNTQPFMMICSSRRAEACAQAAAFKDKVIEMGGDASVLPLDLSHGEINADLGLDSAYTAAVDAFLTKIGATP